MSQQLLPGDDRARGGSGANNTQELVHLGIFDPSGSELNRDKIPADRDDLHVEAAGSYGTGIGDPLGDEPQTQTFDQLVSSGENEKMQEMLDAAEGVATSAKFVFQITAIPPREWQHERKRYPQADSEPVKDAIAGLVTSAADLQNVGFTMEVISKKPQPGCAPDMITYLVGLSTQTELDAALAAKEKIEMRDAKGFRLTSTEPPVCR